MNQVKKQEELERKDTQRENPALDEDSVLDEKFYQEISRFGGAQSEQNGDKDEEEQPK